MKPFFWKIVICLVPNLLAGWAVWHATTQYLAGEGGFKLGVDLVGGTILVYEIDATKMKLDSASGAKSGDPKELAAYLKKRIDPNDLYNIVVRMVGDTRVEIILPTGGKYRTEKARKAWDEVLTKVKEKWGGQVKDPNVFDVGQGKVNDLAERIQKAIQRQLWPALLKNVWADNPNKDQKSFLEIARENYLPEDQVKKIQPGDYQALADLLQSQNTVNKKTVQEFNTLALNEAWKATIAKIQEKYRSYYPELDLKADQFTPNNRTELIRYIQTKGNPFTGELQVIADTAVGKELAPKGAPNCAGNQRVYR